jgi:hypothetical protein
MLKYNTILWYYAITFLEKMRKATIKFVSIINFQIKNPNCYVPGKKHER